jgi:hypothetical protein
LISHSEDVRLTPNIVNSPCSFSAVDTRIWPRLEEGQEIVELGQLVVLDQALGGRATFLEGGVRHVLVVENGNPGFSLLSHLSSLISAFL